MKKRAWLSLMLAAAVLGTTACGSAANVFSETEKTTADTQQESQDNSEAAEVDASDEDLVTLTYWVPLNGSASKYITSYNENVAYQEAMKRLGIKIEFVHPAIGQEQESFNLLFLGDELPDIIAYADHYTGGEFQGMRDGVFQDITDLVPEYAPDYYKYLTENDEFYRESTDNEGKIVTFNNYKPVGDPPFRRWILNQDFLDELGCEIPETVDEFEAMFDKMLDKGITPYLLDKTGYEVQLMGMYDMYMNSGTRFYQQDGTVKFAPLEDKFLDYLTLLNKWYQKGYISKDFSSLQGTEADTMFDTGQIGTYLTAIVASYNRGQAQGINVVAAPYPRLEKGQKLHWDDCDVWPRTKFNETTVAISKDCKNVEAAMKFLNYGYTEEGADLYNWGVEGVNWDWRGDKRVYNDTMLNNPKFGTEEASYIYKVHMAAKLTYPDVECHANLLKSEGALNSRLMWSNDENSDSSLQLPPFQLGEEDQQTVADVATPIYTYVDEMTLKFITGAEPLENFDTFRDTIRSMGMDEVLELEQKGYEEYMSKNMN